MQLTNCPGGIPDGHLPDAGASQAAGSPAPPATTHPIAAARGASPPEHPATGLQNNPIWKCHPLLDRAAASVHWAGRRAIIYRASRGWSARLWSNARAAVRMFMHRHPRGERPLAAFRAHRYVSIRSREQGSITRAVRGAKGMVTILLPPSVMTRARCQAPDTRGFDAGTGSLGDRLSVQGWHGSMNPATRKWRSASSSRKPSPSNQLAEEILVETAWLTEHEHPVRAIFATELPH